MNAIGYRWFCVRVWWYGLPQRCAWWVAWRLPRQVALMAFVRVSSAGGREVSDMTYDHCYQDWERGAGK